MKYQILGLICLLAVACAPIPDATVQPNSQLPDTDITNSTDNMSTNQPRENPFSPQPDDTKFSRGNVFINESGIVIRESYPPQISLALSGDLPTPCHQLRVQINAPNREKSIVVDVYSVVDPTRICTEVLKPFEEYIDLGTFPSGHYSVWVNGGPIGEFDS